MGFFRRLFRTIAIADGWKVLTVQATFIIFLEIAAIVFVSDCISILILDDPELRADIFWAPLGFSAGSDSFFVFYTAAIAVVYFLLIVTQRSFLMRTSSIGYSLSSKVFDSLGELSFTRYSAVDKSNLSAVLVPETQRAASAVVAPVFNLISKFCMVIAIFAYLSLQLGFAIFWVLMLFLPYVLILFFAVAALKRNGKGFTESQKQRQAIISSLLNADKYLYFSDHFERLKFDFRLANERLGRYLGHNSTLSQLPKYTVEMSFGFAAILAASFFSNTESFTVMRGENASLLLVALLKMLPSFQQIYRSIALIMGNFAALENIVQLLKETTSQKSQEVAFASEKKCVVLGDRSGFEICSSSLEVYEKEVRFDVVKVEPGDVLMIGGRSGLGKTTICENFLHLRNDAGIGSLHDLSRIRQEMGSLSGVIAFAGQSAFCDSVVLKKTLDTQTQLPPKRLQTLLADWNLTDVIQSVLLNSAAKFTDLSGGQRRKLSLLVALLSDASLVFLDEPTNDLDSGSRNVLMQIVQEIAQTKNRIFLVISHDAEFKRIATKSSTLSEVS